MKNTLKKQKDRAFRKDVFLLGVDEHGIKYWLEEASWDCEWYWGFGYVETYRQNWRPSKARGIDSHRHIDSSFLGRQEVYDSDKNCWKLGAYVSNLYESTKLAKTTFSEKEGWKLSELFKQFYLLKNMAAFCHKEKPGCHITESPVDHGNMKAWYEQINKVMLPKVFEAIYGILTPKEYAMLSKDDFKKVYSKTVTGQDIVLVTDPNGAEELFYTELCADEWIRISVAERNQIRKE